MTGDEAAAFVSALDSCAPGSLSACHGWTAHEVVAHLTAAAIEVAIAIEAYKEGRAVPDTRGFEEREAPYRAMPDDRLRTTLPIALDRMIAALDAVLREEPDAVVPWTGRQMVVATFPTHMRSELALHRWDLVGDDDTSRELLGQAALTDHAVAVLGRALVARGAPSVNHDLEMAMVTPDLDDVVAIIDADGARLERRPSGGDPVVIADAAARLLLLWGRRTSDPRRITVPAGAESLVRLQGLLAGY